jgi:hypothetical protein
MIIVINILLIGMREGEELKTPRHASAAATRDDRLPHSRQYIFFIFYFFYIRCIILRTILHMQPLGYGAIVLYI